MFCSISGHVPEEPVINKNTGHIYEKRLIEKTIQDTGQDPLSNTPLSLDDLLDLKSNKAVKPRPSPATSIPGMLNLFQGEWDALMLEMHQLRQALGSTRQELSYTLYMQDAATRVIARLVRERDEARALAESAQAAAAAALPTTDGVLANGKRPVPAVEEQPAKRSKAGITPDVVDAMTAVSATLSKGRKKRVISPSLTSVDGLQSFAQLSSAPLHKTTQGGILAIDVAPDTPNLLATAGVDGAVHLYDRTEERIAANLTRHSKRVTAAKFLKSGKSLVTGSADGTACLWSCAADSSTYSPLRLTDHSEGVVAVAVHASRDYFVTASSDKSWCFYEAASGLCLQQVKDDKLESTYSSAAFHPDGLILGTGMLNSTVVVWETRSPKVAAKFQGHKGPVNALSFSENGYYLATAGAEGAKLWDLRKLGAKCNFRTLDVPGGASDLAFDLSGLYLGIAGGEDARIVGTKQDWAVLSRFPDLPKKGASAVAWGQDAAQLYVGAADHNLRVFGLPAATDAAAAMET